MNCSLYAVARPSVYLSSVVCLSVGNVRAPYSGGCNFRQYFYGICILAIRWHPRKISRRSSQGNPSVGGLKHNRGFQTAISDLSKAISRKRCKIGGKLALISNRSRIWAFDCYQNRWPWMTLNGVMAVILRYFTELVYDVVVKQLPRFQNLLLIVCDHITTSCAIVRRLFRQNKVW